MFFLNLILLSHITHLTRAYCFLKMFSYWQRIDYRWNSQTTVEGFQLQKMTKTSSEFGILSEFDCWLTVRMIEKKVGINSHYHSDFEKRSWCETKHRDHLGATPCHTVILINQFLATKNTPVTAKPTYSPYLNPWDSFLFPRLKIN